MQNSRKTLLILLFLITINFVCGFAQIKTPNDPKNIANTKVASDNFSNGLYRLALEEYKTLIKTDSSNLSYNYRLGVCYANTFVDRNKAIYHLDYVSKQSAADISVWYELARVYALTYKFDEAISTFKKYKSLLNGKDQYRISADRWIQMCQEAQGFIKKPVNVSIENVGQEINSIYPDYNPYISRDEGTLVFTSKRKGNTGALLSYDGFNAADIYFSNPKNEKWGKARNIGTFINTEADEECAGFALDGSELFISVDISDGDFQVFTSTRKGKSFQQPIPLGNTISANSNVTACAVSPNKKVLIFSAENNKGIGGKDLYMARKLPNGEWGSTENLGANINTIYDEDFPSFSPDAKTLYFASTGHNSMGGFDIFKSMWDEKTNSWSEPVNLGYPINSPDDEKAFSISSTGRHAYFSSFRKENFGDLDIYRVTFNNIEPSYTVMKYFLLNKDSTQIFSINNEENQQDFQADSINTKKNKVELDFKISIFDKKLQKSIGQYKADKRSGSFVAILPPSEYKLTIESANFITYVEEFKIYDIGTTTKEVKKKIVLHKKLSEN